MTIETRIKTALLDRNENERLVGTGIESHGATHAILTGIPEEAAERELRLAREHLRERGHGAHDLLAYPSGAHDERVAALARRTGHRAAFTTRHGLVSPGLDAMDLPRVLLHQEISRSRAEFRSRVPGRVA